MKEMKINLVLNIITKMKRILLQKDLDDALCSSKSEIIDGCIKTIMSKNT